MIQTDKSALVTRHVTVQDSGYLEIGVCPSADHLQAFETPVLSLYRHAGPCIPQYRPKPYGKKDMLRNHEGHHPP